MGKASFDKREAVQAEAAIAQHESDGGSDDTAVATRQPQALGAVVGEAMSLPVPRMSLIHGVGELSAKFNPGDLVLDGEHQIAKRGEVLKVVILAARSYWKEYLPFGSGGRPREFNSRAEVIAAGGQTEWVDNVAPTFKAAGTFRIMIQKPVGLMCQYFANEIGGQMWAIADWYCDKAAYSRNSGKKGVGPAFLKACMFTLSGRTELPEGQRVLAGLWELKTGVEKLGENNTNLPYLTLVGQNDAAFVKEILEKVRF